LDVTTEAVPLLARALEEDASVRPFRLSVTSETRARISATVSPVASVGARGRPQTRNFLRK
jgi:hypothetical protein